VVGVNRLVPAIGYNQCQTFTGVSPCTVNVAAGASDLVSLSGGDNLYVNVEANSLIVLFGPSGGAFGPESVLIVFTDLDFGGGISGVTACSNLQGFNVAQISFTADSVTLAAPTNIGWTGAQTLTIGLLSADVPIPASAPLLALGLAGLRLLRRARKRA
jgi:hypothetical protein